MTMPPLAEDPEGARPWFAALRELRDRLAPKWEGRHEFRHLSMGTSQDYAVAAAEGGARSYGWEASSTGGKVFPSMQGHVAFDLGLLRRAEEDWEDEYDEDGSAANEDLEQPLQRTAQRPPAEPRRGRARDFDEIFSTSEPLRASAAAGAAARAPAPPRTGTAHAPQVSLVVPKTFNDAQTVADKLKADVPVIINLQAADADLAKRLIDFSSGLTYALDGTHAAGGRPRCSCSPRTRSPVSAEDKALADGARLLQPVLAAGREAARKLAACRPGHRHPRDERVRAEPARADPVARR